MNIRYLSFLIALLLFGALVPTAAAQNVELRLSDGTRWRGAVGDHVEVRVIERGAQAVYSGELTAAADLWIQLRVEAAGGGERTQTIFRGDIRSIRTLDAPRAERPREPERPASPAEESAPAREGAAPATPREAVAARSQPAAATEFKGVFLLPWTGEVGLEARVDEIEAIIREADRHGEGQIIILEIDSPGGAVAEMQKIAATILEANNRHRIIAWVRAAISAGAATAASCNEIYFATEGTLGAITMLQGDGQSVGQELQERNAHYIGQWFAAAGRPALIAHAMIFADREVSYDKDAQTGRVTWYPNTSGQYVLSTKGQNLVFNANNAVHSGFAQGIANTTDELAKLLDLPEWREVNNVGRELHERWMQTYRQANEALRVAMSRYQNPVGRDALDRLGHRIRQVEEMLRWYDRAPNVAERQLGPRESWERRLRDMRKDMGDMRRQQRRG